MFATRQVILHAAEEGGYWVEVPSAGVRHIA